jgi:hypothetical protein
LICALRIARSVASDHPSRAPTAVIDVATGRCETTAKLEAPALEAAFRATFGQLLASMH